MTKDIFQKAYAEDLKKFMGTPCGQALLATLATQRPPYEFSVQNHLLVENRGAMRGYELCMKNLLSLSTPTVVPRDVEANYGVPDAPGDKV